MEKHEKSGKSIWDAGLRAGDVGRFLANTAIVLSGAAPFAGLAFTYVQDHHWIAIGVASLGAGSLCSAVTIVVGRIRSRKKERLIGKARAKLRVAEQAFDRKANELLRVALSRRVPPERELAELKSLLREYLKQICVTATEIYAAVKGKNVPLEANIKRIELIRDPTTGQLLPHYRPLVRSYVDFKRIRYDDWLENNPIPVSKNAAYRRMVPSDSVGNTYYNPSKGFAATGDIERLIGELMRADGEPFLEPNMTVTEGFYRSFLVHPVGGQTDLDNPKWLHADGLVIPALMCVDSSKKGVFSEKESASLTYDLNLMRELTDAAFKAIETFAMIVSDELAESA